MSNPSQPVSQTGNFKQFSVIVKSSDCLHHIYVDSSASQQLTRAGPQVVHEFNRFKIISPVGAYTYHDALSSKHPGSVRCKRSTYQGLRRIKSVRCGWYQAHNNFESQRSDFLSLFQKSHLSILDRPGLAVCNTLDVRLKILQTLANAALEHRTFPFYWWLICGPRQLPP